MDWDKFNEPAGEMFEKSYRAGQKAPDFKLTCPQGQVFNLEHLRKKGPVILYFYRGVW